MRCMGNIWEKQWDMWGISGKSMGNHWLKPWMIFFLVETMDVFFLGATYQYHVKKKQGCTWEHDRIIWDGTNRYPLVHW